MCVEGRAWRASIVREYVFTLFLKIPKTRLFTFFWNVMSKKRKKRRKRCPSFQFLHFEIANERFHCKTITHIIHNVMLYIQHYIKTVHFILKYNGFDTVRKTTKLIERSHRGFRTIGIFLRFFTFFTFFLKILKVVTFYVFLPCFERFLELCVPVQCRRDCLKRLIAAGVNLSAAVDG